MTSETASVGPDPDSALVTALTELHLAVGEVACPLAVPSAARARLVTAELRSELADQVIPRLRRPDAPLLAVIGGTSGAGKSTLVNSLVQAPVSPTGALRPTTRSALLVCHPDDASWFDGQAPAARLASAGPPGEGAPRAVWGRNLLAGLALVDAPDVDTVVNAHRRLTSELLTAGDLCLFATTPARGADAVPWRLLREAGERGTAVALVVGRVAPEARDEIASHYSRLVVANGLGEAPLFVIRDLPLDGRGLLPEHEVAPIMRWLDGVASSGVARRDAARRAVLRAVESVTTRAELVARGIDDQVAAATLLAGKVRSAYAAAMSDVELALRSGEALGGEVHTLWQRLVADGDLASALRTVTGSRARPVGQAAHAFSASVLAALAGLVSGACTAAAEQCRQEWVAVPAGRALLATDPDLGRPRPDVTEAAYRVVSGWLDWLRAAAREQEPTGPAPSRATAAMVLLATIAAVAPPRPGLEADSDAVVDLDQDLLDLERVRRLGGRARMELLVRVGDLLAGEVERHLAPLGPAVVDPGLAVRLRNAIAKVRAAGPAVSSMAA